MILAMGYEVERYSKAIHLMLFQFSNRGVEVTRYLLSSEEASQPVDISVSPGLSTF